MDQPWKWTTCWFRVPPRISCHAEATSTQPRSYQNPRCTGSGSFGTKYTGSISILFQMGGILSRFCVIKITYTSKLGFCRNRPGNCYIEQGEYKIMHPEGRQIVGRSEFPSAVEPGMILKMNIILRKDSGYQANREKCPRPHCCYINSNVTATHRWIEWKVPFMIFHRDYHWIAILQSQMFCEVSSCKSW